MYIWVVYAQVEQHVAKAVLMLTCSTLSISSVKAGREKEKISKITQLHITGLQLCEHDIHLSLNQN